MIIYSLTVDSDGIEVFRVNYWRKPYQRKRIDRLYYSDALCFPFFFLYFILSRCFI